MNSTKWTLGAGLGAGLLAVAALGAGLGINGAFNRATAEDATKSNGAAAFTADQKAGIEAIVKDYLIANPEILFEVQRSLEAKMEKEQEERLKTAIKENKDELYHRADAPSAGAAKGDITVVEFFDYNCGYCKRGFSEVAKLVEKDKNVRVVFKELPILSKGSEEASRVALAAKKQGKYWELHSALLKNRGANDEKSALKIAGKLGLDVEKLKADMNSEEVAGEINKVRALAQKMGINGTPHFLVGDRAIPGAPENLFELIEAHVKDLRQNGCDVC